MSATCEDNGAACSLLDLPEGSMLHVEDLEGSCAERSRLYAMGILPGTSLELCQRCGRSGSLHVRVRHSSLVLAKEIAGCIRCRKLGPASVQ